MTLRICVSSGDLSTKACYVERILTDEDGNPIGSQLIQWINFDMGQYAGANGAQAVVDPGNDRILFQMRKLGNISDPANSWVVGEYPPTAPRPQSATAVMRPIPSRKPPTATS